MRITDLNDGTNGFRFNIAGIKGLTRKRQAIKRYGIKWGDAMTALHLGKRSIYIEGGKRRELGNNFAG
jgi:hypothetical protein